MKQLAKSSGGEIYALWDNKFTVRDATACPVDLTRIVRATLPYVPPPSMDASATPDTKGRLAGIDFARVPSTRFI